MNSEGAARLLELSVIRNLEGGSSEPKEPPWICQWHVCLRGVHVYGMYVHSLLSILPAMLSRILLGI